MVFNAFVVREPRILLSDYVSVGILKCLLNANFDIVSVESSNERHRLLYSLLDKPVKVYLLLHLLLCADHLRFSIYLFDKISLIPEEKNP